MNDELFLLSNFSDSLDKNLPRNYNVSLHATWPTWIPELKNEFILHIFWIWKKEILNIIFSSDELLEKSIDDFKKIYLKHWKKVKLIKSKFTFEVDDINSSFDSLKLYLISLREFIKNKNELFI